MNLSKFVANLRIAYYNLYSNTISRLKRKYHKFNLITVDKPVYTKVKNDPEFVASIQLSRFISTIRSAQRNYLRVPNDGKYPNTRDRIEQQYLYAAVVYEIVQALPGLFGRLKRLGAWQQNLRIVKYINDERNDASSYYNRVFKPLRNQVAFHFNEIAISQAVDLIYQKDSILLASSETLLNKDMVFNLADDLVLNYIVSQNGTVDPSREEYECLLRYVIDFSDKIVSLASACILEIWSKYADSQCGRIAE